MYKIQRQGRWEACEGLIVAVSGEVLTVEDGGGRWASIPVSSVQGWVYDPTPARTLEEPGEEAPLGARPQLAGLEEPVEESLSEGVTDADPV